MAVLAALVDQQVQVLLVFLPGLHGHGGPRGVIGRGRLGAHVLPVPLPSLPELGVGLQQRFQILRGRRSVGA